MTLIEDDFEFNFSGAMKAIKFDDGATYAATSIQPVDFLVEYADRYCFIEVKDPDNPAAVNVSAFFEKLKSGKLIRSLAGKYRDSLFARSFQNVASKKNEYVVLISMSELDEALLLTKQDELQKSIPLWHDSWERPSATACVILNVKQWKKYFGETSIRRVSGVPL